MKRIILSNNDLEKVIELCQRGDSWLKIQGKTKISRHVAKRSYEEWERRKSADSLKGVRLIVAEQEFKQHLNHLSKVAVFLTDNLAIPSSPDIGESAEQFWDRLWQSRIVEEFGLEVKGMNVNNQQSKRNTRQNLLLFQSLQSHTRDKVRWEALKEWKSGWNDSLKHVNELRERFFPLIDGTLKQKPELLTILQKGLWGKDAPSEMVSAALSTVWKGIIDDEALQEPPLVKMRPDIKGGDKGTAVDVGRKEMLFLTKQKDAGFFTQVLNSAITVRFIDDNPLFQQLAASVRRMKGAIRELEEALNPLLIRPLILRTRCDLCPV
ncbi:hypothetical protein ACFLUS_01025 [Chloroflexota bacterium]